MKITVIIPTYRRPTDLARCLEALKRETRPPDEVLVVVRDIDTVTWEFLKDFNPDSLPLQTVTVIVPGQVAALNAGLDIAQGDIIAITDDDAAPHADWLARIEAHFLSDSCIGGVGGRDWRYSGTHLEDGAEEVVGKLQWFGRKIGNHHLGVGSPREVDILKGANMSYRRTAIAQLRFDERLRGSGAQVHNDMAFSLAVQRAGYKLIYDPAVAVDHYEGIRDNDDRVGFINSSTAAVFDASYNETLILLQHLPIIRAIVYFIWSFLVGTRLAFGLVQLIRFTPQYGWLTWQRFVAVQQGKFSALLTAISSKSSKKHTLLENISTLQNPQQVPETNPLRQISVVIITQNEEARIGNAIRSCLAFADEVVVVDGGSQDTTVQRAQELGCKVKVYENPWPGYAKQRNFGAEKATYDWIFFIDSDEVVSEELTSALVQWKKTPHLEANAFEVRRMGDFFGQWLEEIFDYQLRLYNKKAFQIKDVLVHEGPDIGNAPVGKIPGILWHYGFRSIEDHVRRFNVYTNLEADKAFLEGKKFSLVRLLLRPPARFLHKYFGQGLYKKGVTGLTVAFLWIYYEFLKEIKLYEIYWKQEQPSKEYQNHKLTII